MTKQQKAKAAISSKTVAMVRRATNKCVQCWLLESQNINILNTAIHYTQLCTANVHWLQIQVSEGSVCAMECQCGPLYDTVYSHTLRPEDTIITILHVERL